MSEQYNIHILTHTYTSHQLADFMRTAGGELYTATQMQLPDTGFWRDQVDLFSRALQQRRAADLKALPTVNGKPVGATYLRAEQIKDRCDVVDIVGRFVNLRRTGSHYKALCPFHDEHTPSFVVFPDKANWHCFGCGANGDVIDFIGRTKRLNYTESVKELAAMVGVAWQTQPQVPPRWSAEL